MSDVPKDVRALAVQREEARQRKDFAAADAVRETIRGRGFEVTDTPQGFVLSPLEAPETGRASTPGEIASLLDRPAAFDVSLQWIAQGWPQDIVRGIASFDRSHGDLRIHHVVADLLDDDSSDGSASWQEDADVVRLAPSIGWAAGRNAALVRADGAVVVVVDGSIEATGDALTPMVRALDDPSVGVTGPFGIVTRDLREFHEAPGPECDAVEGYLMAFRRELVEGGLRFDQKFKFYRTADIELSFRVKAMGLRATVTPVPIERHEHRLWANTPPDRRDALSKRNFYRFLDRWRGRTDLLVSGPD